MTMELDEPGQTMSRRAADALADGKDVIAYVAGITPELRLAAVELDGGCVSFRTIYGGEYVVRVDRIQHLLITSKSRD